MTNDPTLADASSIVFKADNIKDVNALASALDSVAPSFDKIPGLTATLTEAATHLRTLGESSYFTEIIASLVKLSPLFRSIENHVAQCPIDASNKAQFTALMSVLDELKSLIPEIQPNLVHFMPGKITTVLSLLLMIPFIDHKTERAFSSVASCASGITCLINFKVSSHENSSHIDLYKLVRETKEALGIKDPMPANQTLMPLAFLSRTILRAITVIDGNPALKEDPAIAAQVAEAVIEAKKAHQKIMDRKKQLEHDKANLAFYDIYSSPILENQIKFCADCELEFDTSMSQLRSMGILKDEQGASPQTQGYMLSAAGQRFIAGADAVDLSPKNQSVSLQSSI